MIRLPTSSPICTPQANGWQQISFTLNAPFPIEVGTRLQLGAWQLAPWRVDQQHIDCLAMPCEDPLTLSAPIHVIKQGKPLGHVEAQHILLSGQDLAIADIFLAASLLKHIAGQTLILMASNTFPFAIKPARFLVPALPNLIASCPLLDDWGFANRLASHDNLPGCHHGTLSELMEIYVRKNQIETFHNIML